MNYLTQSSFSSESSRHCLSQTIRARELTCHASFCRKRNLWRHLCFWGKLGGGSLSYLPGGMGKYRKAGKMTYGLVFTFLFLYWINEKNEWVREGLRLKNHWICDHRTPPHTLFFGICDCLRLFFLKLFFFKVGNQVRLKTNFNKVWN